MDILKELNQTHIKLPEDQNHPLYEQVKQLEKSYPGGVNGYCENARKLLKTSNQNPYEGYKLSVPLGQSIDFQNQTQIDELEQIGVQELKDTCFVLVAGGLGERLGYKGIKIQIPIDLITLTSYIQYYIEYILAFQKKGNTEIPLVIMVSDDTNEQTIDCLKKNNNFGMKPDQITLVKQQKVPAIINNNADLSFQNDLCIETKPHGHGDVHLLLSQSGIVDKWYNQGKKWVIFFQDTNAAVFKSIPSVLGVSKKYNYEMNSICAPRKAGEAVGAICSLEKGDHKMTLNIEYNQIQNLFEGGVEPKDENGYSQFPGNINCLVFSVKEYNQTLKETNGLIAEFINPKYEANSTNFKSPARLECMMQDYPKLLKNCERVGFTQIDRLFCISPCKNNLETSQQKKAQGLPLDSAESAESEFYELNQKILQLCGVKFEGNAFVVLKPSLGITLKEIREKVTGNNLIKNNSILILNDGFENLELDGCIKIDQHVKNQKISNQQYPKKIDVAKEDPDYLQIRGYNYNLPKIEK